jgi:hypothetical protein
MENKISEKKIIDKEKDNENNINKNKITEKHLKNLDDFIQKCLDNFKFVEPKQELYDATGADKNIIISHKSTIPDLVIWNKTFNKNNCFFEANNNKETKFPRYLFYIKIKKNKKTKKNCIENKKGNITINNNLDNKFLDKNNIENNSININNNIIPKNIIKNNKCFNKIEEKNKFSMNENNNIENNMNFINMEINLASYLINLYLNKDGWIILTKDNNFSGPGTSINLYQYLQEKIKENCNLDNYIIIDINKQVKFKGYIFYNLLSNVLNKILQKKQMELMKFENIMSKQFKNDKSNNNNININLYNNQIFPGINYIGNINNNISNLNFIENNITNYEYNVHQYQNKK